MGKVQRATPVATAHGPHKPVPPSRPLAGSATKKGRVKSKGSSSTAKAATARAEERRKAAEAKALQRRLQLQSRHEPVDPALHPANAFLTLRISCENLRSLAIPRSKKFFHVGDGWTDTPNIPVQTKSSSVAVVASSGEDVNSSGAAQQQIVVSQTRSDFWGNDCSESTVNSGQLHVTDTDKFATNAHFREYETTTNTASVQAPEDLRNSQSLSYHGVKPVVDVALLSSDTAYSNIDKVIDHIQEPLLEDLALNRSTGLAPDIWPLHNQQTNVQNLNSGIATISTVTALPRHYLQIPGAEHFGSTPYKRTSPVIPEVSAAVKPNLNHHKIQTASAKTVSLQTPRSLVVKLKIPEGWCLDEKMAPRRDSNSVHEAIRNVVQNLFDVQTQVHGFVPETQPLLVDKMTELAHSLAHVQTLTSPVKSPNNPIHQVRIAPEIIDYVDDGRNPDIFTRDFVELVTRGNAVINGKQQAFRDFSSVFADALKSGLDGVDEDVDRVMKNAEIGNQETTKQDKRENGIVKT